MSLINCSECKKEISDLAESCPQCGYKLKLKKDVSKKPRVFQYISIVAFAVSLFSPQLFTNFFVLIIISSAIISLIRKEGWWGLSFLFILFGFLLLVLPSLTKLNEKKYIQNVIIVKKTWVKEENYTYVRGSVLNLGDRDISYFKVKVYYLSASGDVIDTDIDNDSEVLKPGMSKEFEVMHKNNPEYTNIRVEVDEVSLN